MTEVIKNLDFLGYPNYSISNTGKLYSHFKIGYANFRITGREFDKNKFNLINPTKCKEEHHQVQIRICTETTREVVNVSFLVASAFIDNPNKHLDIEYLDGNPANLNAANLKWTTKKFYLVPGYSFITDENVKCTIIGVTDDKHVDVLLFSDNVVGNIKGIILNATIKSIVNKRINHPFVPSVYNTGCIGLGPYCSHTTKNGVDISNTIYSRWNLMLARCYSNINQPSYKTYYGLPVSEEFKNYQNYAYFITNLMKESNIDNLDEFEIDKDFKAQFGSGYSRETLSIVPAFMNSFVAIKGAGKGVLPPGVAYVPTTDEFRSGLVNNNKTSLKAFRTSDDININMIYINELIDIYVKGRTQSAKDVLKKCFDLYPNIKLDPFVIKILQDFDKYMVESVYLKTGWIIEKLNGKYKLSDTMVQRVIDRLEESHFMPGFRISKGTYLDYYQ